VATLSGHSNTVLSAAFHPTEPLIVTGSDDGTAKLWRMNFARTAADCVATLAGHGNTVRSATFHPTESLIATVSHDKTIKLWK
jgi:coatomer protein complex subunit alpha (xenin)